MICLRKYKLHHLGVETDINIYDVLMFDYLYKIFKDVKQLDNIDDDIGGDSGNVYYGYNEYQIICSIINDNIIVLKKEIYEQLSDYMFKKLKLVENSTIADMTNEINIAMIEFIDDVLNIKIERITC